MGWLIYVGKFFLFAYPRMDSGTENIALRLIVCLKANKSPEFVELFFWLHNCVIFDTASNYLVKANLFFSNIVDCFYDTMS